MSEEDKVAQEKYDAAGFGSFNITENLLLYIVMAAGFLVVLIGMGMLASVYKFRRKIIKKIRGIRKAFFWNGWIRSNLFTYLKQFVSFGLATKVVNFEQDDRNV